MSVEAISALERGTRRHPRHDTVRLLAEALGLPHDRRQWGGLTPRPTVYDDGLTGDERAELFRLKRENNRLLAEVNALNRVLRIWRDTMSAQVS